MSNIVSILEELSAGEGTLTMSQFTDLFINGKEVKKFLDLDDCKYCYLTRQELLIYSKSNYVKYSCSYTVIFGRYIIIDLWGSNCGLIHRFDGSYDRTYNQLDVQQYRGKKTPYGLGE